MPHASPIGFGARPCSIILAAAGAVWWCAAGSVLTRPWSAILTAAGVAIAVAVVRRARCIRDLPPPDPRRTMRTYWVINVTQAAAIAVSAAALGRADHTAVIPGVVAAVVGLHFLPLAGLFGWIGYRSAGLVGVAIGAGGAVVGAATGDIEWSLPSVAIPFGLLLWSTVGALIRGSVEPGSQ